MNDATGPVGAAPWPAPDAQEGQGPPGERAIGHDSIEYDGRLWPLEAPDPEPEEDAFDRRAWAAHAPHAAAEAWALAGPHGGADGVWSGAEAVGFDPFGDPFAGSAWPDGNLADAGPDAEREAVERQIRLDAANDELSRDIEGWSPEVAQQVAAFGQAQGFTAEELSGVEDAREVKILHLAMLGQEALAREAAARAFGGFRPPTQLNGGGYAGALPTDRQSTDAWMSARQAQLRKKARA